MFAGSEIIEQLRLAEPRIRFEQPRAVIVQFLFNFPAVHSVSLTLP